MTLICSGTYFGFHPNDFLNKATLQGLAGVETDNAGI
jgi:hypothetical protein